MDKSFDYNALLCIGKFFMAIGFMLIGPSYFWGIEENIWVMLSGICVLGFSASFAILPLMPIIMNEIKTKFIDDKIIFIETASSLYNSAFGLGNIIGPIVGSHLSSYFGFRICTDILSHFSIVVFILLLASQYIRKIVNYFAPHDTPYVPQLTDRMSKLPIQHAKFTIYSEDVCPNIEEVKIPS